MASLPGLLVLLTVIIIVQTPEGFKKTEGPELSSGAILPNKKNVRDEIKIRKL